MRGACTAGPFSGGHDGTDSNWPGIGRPPLVINGNKFILNFRSDESVNSWGWRMIVQPAGGASHCEVACDTIDMCVGTSDDDWAPDSVGEFMFRATVTPVYPDNAAAIPLFQAAFANYVSLFSKFCVADFEELVDIVLRLAVDYPGLDLQVRACGYAFPCAWMCECGRDVQTTAWSALPFAAECAQAPELANFTSDGVDLLPFALALLQVRPHVHMLSRVCAPVDLVHIRMPPPRLQEFNAVMGAVLPFLDIGRATGLRSDALIGACRGLLFPSVKVRTALRAVAPCGIVVVDYHGMCDMWWWWWGGGGVIGRAALRCAQMALWEAAVGHTEGASNFPFELRLSRSRALAVKQRLGVDTAGKTMLFSQARPSV